MDSFNYNNIFETKGIEYLVVIAFLALLIPFWLFLSRKVTANRNLRKALGVLTAGTLRIPRGVYFSLNHTWAYLEMSGNARIGLNDLLLRITGDVRFGNLKKPGDKVLKGDLLAEISHEGKTLRIFSPVSGEIVDTNAALTDDPGLISEDPYMKGWMYKVKPERWINETRSCYVAEDATGWMVQELVRFREFISGPAGNVSPESARLVMQDGGELKDHTLTDLPAEVWQRFQQNFLNGTGEPGKKEIYPL